MNARLPLGLVVSLLLLATPLARATTVVQPTFEKLVGSSDYIVRAVVKSVDSEWRTSKSNPNEAYIGSKVTLEVLEAIKGTPPNPLVLNVVGGRVGEDELYVDGAPKFVVGEENVLFVKGNGTSFFPLTGLMHGFFPVRHDAATGRSEVRRFDGRLLYSERELDPSTVTLGVRSAQDRAMTAETFRSRIQEQQNAITSREKLR